MTSIARGLIKHIVYPAYEAVSGRSILSKLAHLNRSQWWSPQRIRSWQRQQLTELVQHAYDTVPYYRRLFDLASSSPLDVRRASDLPRLPLLTKTLIQEHKGNLVSTAYSPDRRIPNHTGGSTGTPMHFYQDQRQRDWGSATKLRCNSWAGWDFGKRTLRLWGHPRDVKATQTVMGKLRNRVLREYTFDAFGFSTSDMEDLVQYMRRKPPDIIVAYASMLTHFAGFIEDREIHGLPIPDGIVTSADMLLPHQRELIERVLRAPVFNRYGCREVSDIAAECAEHAGMHVFSDRLIVEFVDDNGEPVAAGEPGRVVVTDLFNYVMPFIRYSIEDVAVPSAQDCPCGRGLPLMKELVGRRADILTTPDGRFVSATALTTILSKIPGLRECQLVQKASDWLQVNVVSQPHYDDSSEETFREQLTGFFGPKMRITFRYVESIPRTASGKNRFSVSEIEKVDL